MIQRINSYNLLTDNVAEKVPWTIYWPDKKCKKKSTGEWPTNIAKKTVANKSVEINLSGYVSTKYLLI